MAGHCTQKARVKNEWKLLSRCRCREVVAPVQGMSERAARIDGGDPSMDFGGWWYDAMISSFNLSFYSATVVHQ
ncbi:hypothetical protein Tco_0240660, partial [Tanacetum coccineum]